MDTYPLSDTQNPILIIKAPSYITGSEDLSGLRS